MRLSMGRFSIGWKVIFVFGLGLAILLFISVISYNNISVMISTAVAQDNA